MTRAWQAWVELMDRREPPTALALVRIGVALVALGNLLWAARLGLVDALFEPLPHGYATAYQPWMPLGGHALWLAAVIAAAAVAAGAATPIACVAFSLISAQLSQLASDSETGFDQLLRIVMIVLALSRCNAKWAIDGWVQRKLGHPPPADVPAWPRYLLMLQLVWVYFSGGQNKAGSEWGPLGGFTALGDSLTDPHAARFDPAWLGTFYPITRIATAVVMIFELTAPLYLLSYYFAETAKRSGRLRTSWNRLRIRWIWLTLGVAFECGIAVTLRLGDFPWGMLALYPVLLLPDELQWRNVDT
jgi:hypothetical protein